MATLVNSGGMTQYTGDTRMVRVVRNPQGEAVQLPLFAEKPLARASDPPSSKAAARRLVTSGKHESDKARVLEALRECPGSSSKAVTRVLASKYGDVLHRLSPPARPGARRLGAARRSGRSRRSDVVACRVGASRARTLEHLCPAPPDARTGAGFGLSGVRVPYNSRRRSRRGPGSVEYQRIRLVPRAVGLW